MSMEQQGKPPAIDMRGVGVMRGERWILKDVDWRVPAEELVAVLGPNGSGKSTLARLAACHWWPTAGECRILGGEFGKTDLPELRKRIRLVQAAGPFDVDPELTALEVVLTGFFGSIGLYGKVTEQMREGAGKLLGHVGLGDHGDHTYRSMSSGERVRSLIARAMAARPELLILDEPTAGLDLLGREQVLATVKMLIGMKGAPAVVMITHHVEELAKETSKVILLSHGKVAAQGTMGEVLTGENLSRVYGVAVAVRQSQGRYYLEVMGRPWGE